MVVMVIGRNGRRNIKNTEMKALVPMKILNTDKKINLNN